MGEYWNLIILLGFLWVTRIGPITRLCVWQGLICFCKHYCCCFLGGIFRIELWILWGFVCFRHGTLFLFHVCPIGVIGWCFCLRAWLWLQFNIFNSLWTFFLANLYVGPPSGNDWFEKQISGTIDISCSTWMDWFHGGLQF